LRLPYGYKVNNLRHQPLLLALNRVTTMTLTPSPPLTIAEATNNIVAQWQRLVTNNQHKVIRLGVLSGGCAGLQAVLPCC